MPALMPPTVADTPALAALRADVRRFLAEQIAAGRFTPAVDTWLTGWNTEFSQALAAQGWLGMTIPIEYGGLGRSFVERFVVTEELLVAGAPVAAHWIADRQAAPSLLRFGSELQKQRFLPAIARGECFWALGMSEPDSGSDLASVRTRAERVEGGWRLTGTKVWTSGAHHAHAMSVLARTSPADPTNRHAGLSQLIVELPSPGVEIRPILGMNGGHDFNEVTFDGAFVPDERVLGDVGAGWHQVTAELGYERSGPERVLSTYVLLAELVDATRDGQVRRHADLGRYVARVASLHHLSSAVAAALERHAPVETAAAVVKVLGTTTEGDIADLADRLIAAGSPPELRDLASQAVVQRPGFTLRGGTNEVLRGVIAREMGLR
ncbi:acyl-CoA dehydrogenase family protein [Streptomyces sp. RLB1-33]|uniref:acyl-CoA dehydrogenase family protein n=1 Tax=Streptomyces mirabilis TaxID=68239 RepID=UPI00143E4C26|nr:MULTISPECIES: acyl-CoA dehydrogenase family protein [Streptomyces]QIY74833.1 acyl-CoA dehydrogenase [Streptomyces sp. RLB1-33]QUW78007.1 acyl-CoA dehydrogenase family protein [Streptomyces mirabilis]